MKKTLRAATAATAAAVSLLVLAGCGDDAPTPAGASDAPSSDAPSSDAAASSAPAPTPTPSPPADAAPSVAVPKDLAGMFPEPDIAQLGPGRSAAFGDGTRARLVSRGGRTRLEVSVGGAGTATSAALAPDADAPYLLDVQLDLGRAGAGWVVGHEGGDSARLQVYVLRDGELVVAEAPAAPPLGDGFDASGGYHRTWATTAGVLHTRVPTAEEGRFRLLAWEVAGDAGDAHPRLVARQVGRVCITESATRYAVRHC